ncbi:MAG: ABC transporter permease [Treponema sp.]|jgi:ribose/xylose/arabinose/galactoside ABC-type transport system permease subunit|nr:ABC transporter permease [Treponema sp.]
MNSKAIINKTGQGSLFLIFMFIVIAGFFALMNRSFFTFSNFVDVLMRVSVTAPIATGIMFCLIVKGIDLSSGTVVGLVGIILADMVKMGKPLVPGILLVLLIGSAVGAVDGLLIAKLNMNPFVATLAVMFVGLSFEKVITQGGLPVYLHGSVNALSGIYRNHLLGVPIPIVILAVIVAAAYLISEKMVIGRRLRASGESIMGAMNAGIKVRLYFAGAYIISGFLAACSGIIVASQVQAGQPLVGQSYLWDAIGAAYLSTTLSKYRRPNVFGTVFGAFFLSMVNNGLTLLGLPFYWKTFFNGLIILFILLVSAINRSFMQKADRA